MLNKIYILRNRYEFVKLKKAICFTIILLERVILNIG